jgi:hypothetical protein
VGKNKFLDQLEYPIKIPRDYLVVHIKFNKELISLFKTSGLKKNITVYFEEHLVKLIQWHDKATYQSKVFVKLNGVDLYEFRILLKKNVRIIYHFIKDSGKNKPVFLLAFEEKDNKSGGKSSFDAQIPKALSRLREIKGR